MPVSRLVGLVMRRPIARGLALAIVAALVLLSLLPAALVVRTGAGSYAEHFVAYSLAGVMLLRLFSVRRHGILIGGMIALAGLLEFLQHFTVSRTPDLPTFLYSCAGVLSAVLLTRLLAGQPSPVSPRQPY